MGATPFRLICEESHKNFIRKYHSIKQLSLMVAMDINNHSTS